MFFVSNNPIFSCKNTDNSPITQTNCEQLTELGVFSRVSQRHQALKPTFWRGFSSMALVLNCSKALRMSAASTCW